MSEPTLWDTLPADEPEKPDDETPERQALADEADASAPARRVWSVGELVGLARGALEDAFPWVWVRGEVSNFHAHGSGHWYFKLKDEHAVLDVAMFRTANVAVPFDVEEGLEVVAGGRLTIYPLRGRFQLVAEALEPVGWGALQLAFEQLKARLQQEGLFDESRKRPLPVLPSCVGVVTSPTGAAWRDLGRVWRRREVPLHVVLAPARVQGPGAAGEIVAALRDLERWGGADVLIVTRGGGSREDLWAFNEEPLARAIAACRTPVIAAVGHEIDVTIAELVADRRAATPTAAAEIVASSRQALVGRLQTAARQSRSALHRGVLGARARLNEPGLQRQLRRPSGLLGVYRQRLDDAWTAVAGPVGTLLHGRRRRVDHLAGRLRRVSPLALALRRQGRLQAAASRATRTLRLRLARAEARAAALAARVHALSPLAVLARGYSICERPRDGHILRNAAEVATGDDVRVRLHRGRLLCRVEGRLEGDG